MTEITAALLERAPGLGRDLALAWLDPKHAAAAERPSPQTADLFRALRALPTDAPTIVETQRQIPDRRVDLELRFEDPATGGQVAVIWVEAKHGTDPHSGQIPAYVRHCPAPGAVVLLSTPDRLPVSDEVECPPDVPQRTWQTTAERARLFARRTALDDPVVEWLLEEWLLYLREEGLLAPNSLGPEHMTALTYYSEAEAALRPICETAMTEVQDTSRPGFREHLPYGLKYWALWQMADTEEECLRWDDAWFDWKIIRSTGKPHGIPTGHVFVMAGLSKPKPGEFTSPWYDELRRGLNGESGPMTFQRWRGDHERLQRVAYLHQIVRGDTLEQQGRELGTWIIETFEALQQHGPPLDPATANVALTQEGDQ